MAEAVYFEAESGAKVFSSGTIRWPWGLSKSGFVNEKFSKAQFESGSTYVGSQVKRMDWEGI